MKRFGHLGLLLLIAAGVHLVVLALLHGMGAWADGWNARISDDWRRRAKLGKVENSQVVHLNISDSDHSLRSDLTERATYIKALNLLSETDVRGLLFDMIFVDPKDPGVERDLAQSLMDFERAYLSIGIDPVSGVVEPGREIPGAFQPGRLSPGEIPYVGRVVSNRPMLSNAAKGIGNITVPADPDGIYRHFPLVYLAGKDQVLPSTVLRMVMDHVGCEGQHVEVVAGKAITLRPPNGEPLEIPVDEAGRMTLDFRGKWGEAFDHLSLPVMLDGEENDLIFDQMADLVDDRFVVFADISTYSHDIGAIPLERHYPLSGIHSNALQQILEGRFYRVVPWHWNLILWGGALVLLSLWAQAKKTSIFLICTPLTIFGCHEVHHWLFRQEGMMTRPLDHFLAMGFTSVAFFIYRHESVQRSRRRLRSQFASYIAPSVLQRVVDKPHMLNIVERKEITVIFTDIAGFTRWSSHQDPATIHAFLNEYFESMTAIIFRHEGTIDKFIGDGLMFFFGDPVEQSDQADRAIRVAFEMQEALDTLRAGWKDRFEMDISLRIGINTGLCTVGNPGSSQRMDYTAVGANVNLAQRLESRCSLGGVLVSARTMALQKDFKGKSTEMAIEAKGYDQPVKVYQLEAQ